MSRPILSMSEHKAQAAKPKTGRRAKEWARFRAAVVREARQQARCPVCGCGLWRGETVIVAHLIPRSLAPHLVCVRENVRVLCAHHGQPEDAPGVKGNLEKRAAVIRERYGPKAEAYLRENWPGRRA